MHVKKTDFLIGAASQKQFPSSNHPEVSFAGRSNVGKSSLINRLVNKKKLAELVFSDKKALNKLDSMIHPSVIKEIEKKCRLKTNLIIDAPLLIETKLHKSADIVIVVKSSKKETIKRLRNQYTKKEIEKILENQLPEKEKTKYADFVINNNGNKKDLEKKVKKVWLEIIKK